ncbi:coiled-coil domain-containing protein 177 [Perca fluviatilis]|uniref:coiled-coil domain-containing protein 177 n=1 Tax=Perca fluviatilis TaxID=8168 RepID=UPI0019641051|nr:coiled-coil domain-containing protein 177 [Perca fluviatilis]XP_039640361.1 coiled-coil domain-containing protein 177 [Perca fluviatilis]
MGELRSTSPGPRLDLTNLDYVLTSPRSLESCTRLGVKPVALLIKSLNELIAEQHGVPFGAMRAMHESYEKERMKLLQMCREERERIIRAAGDRWPGGNKAPRPDTKLKEDHSRDRQTTGSVPYADLCFKGTPASRSSCSHRDPERSTVCSFSLGDLRHTPATEMKLERLTEDVKREVGVTVPERDRKIAALMLVKHQAEQASLKLCQRGEQERQEARRQEEAQRAQAEKTRRKKLRQSMQRWHEELEARRRLRERRETEKAGQHELEVLLQEDRWRRMKEEVEGQRRGKIEAAQRDAWARKRYQEKLLREKEETEERERERERQVAAEKEQKAMRSKGRQGKKERQRLQEENGRELLRHILLKHQVEQQVEEEGEQMRSKLEKKLRHSCEKRAQAAEARLREQKERAAREDEQIRRAQQRAELQSFQQLTHKKLLVQLSQQRMERAALHASAQQRNRAQQTHRHNEHRQLCHQRLRERLQGEEEAMRRVRESCVFMKDWRRERLRRQRQQVQEEAHRLARASFHMRERVRQQTHSRTFDQMALEAQLTASMSRIKL